MRPRTLVLSGSDMFIRSDLRGQYRMIKFFVFARLRGFDMC